MPLPKFIQNAIVTWDLAGTVKRRWLTFLVGAACGFLLRSLLH